MAKQQKKADSKSSDKSKNTVASKAGTNKENTAENLDAKKTSSENKTEEILDPNKTDKTNETSENLDSHKPEENKNSIQENTNNLDDSNKENEKIDKDNINSDFNHDNDNTNPLASSNPVDSSSTYDNKLQEEKGHIEEDPNSNIKKVKEEEQVVDLEKVKIQSGLDLLQLKAILKYIFGDPILTSDAQKLYFSFISDNFDDSSKADSQIKAIIESGPNFEGMQAEYYNNVRLMEKTELKTLLVETCDNILNSDQNQTTKLHALSVKSILLN